ncbi:hypothetical protein [Paracoccus sp. (in: a-proteobacteria)]|uniref:hypothetical protein n=1 Tax=Paracoccus sp. TaxID=267 RepID=UPI002AFEBF01|nr:hypothetical protein [Paracoccus sp. (in: a-proteobacteria)]
MNKPAHVTLDRNEAAKAAATWGLFVARLLRDEVRRDPAGTRRKVSRETRIFIEAICRDTANPFLRGHAEDFAQALEECLIRESTERALAGERGIQKEEPQKPNRSSVNVHKPLARKPAEGIDQREGPIRLISRHNDK